MSLIKAYSLKIFRIIIYILILICAYMLFTNFFNSFYKVCNVSVDIEGYDMGGRPIEVFYIPEGSDDFVPENMVGIDNIYEGEFSYSGSINLPCYNINGFRLDLGNGTGDITIKSLEYNGYNGYSKIGFDTIEKCQMNDLEVVSVNDDSIILRSFISNGTEADPYIIVDNINVTPYKNYSKIYSAIAAIIATAVVYRYVRLKSVYWMFIDLINSRKLLFSLAKNDFKTKFAGSYFGILWAFVQPVCTILVFWFVFQIGFKSTDVGDVPFICWFICGLIPWFFFSEAWGSSTNCLQEYSYLVKKVVFKIHILPMVKILSAFFIHIFFIIFMICVFLFYSVKPSIYWIQVLYYTVCMIALVISLSFITSPLVVFFRDLGQIMNIILQFGMWLTPIMWSIDIIPQRFMWLFKLNPMYYIVQGYRDSFIYNVPFYNNIKQTLYFWLIIFVMMLLGCLMFKKLKPHFADVL